MIKTYISFIFLAITTLTLTFTSDYLARREIAKVHVDSLERFIKIGDLRETALAANRQIGSAFKAFTLSAKDSSEIFHLPPEHRFKSSFFEAHIQFRNAATGSLITFWYSLWPAVFMGLSLFVSLWGFIYFWLNEREKNLKSAVLIERKVEIANMLAQVSHDIRSPLSALNIAVSGIKTDDPERKDLILSATERIKEIADSLLDRHNISISQFPLKDTILPLVREKEVEFSEKGVKVHFCPEQTDAFVKADRSQFCRVISNLINNAVESDADQISLEINTQNNITRIALNDNGPGIPKEVLRKLRKEPISLNKTKKGHGLGLWSAHLFAKYSGGALNISSSLHGTHVTLSLPTQPCRIHV